MPSRYMCPRCNHIICDDCRKTTPQREVYVTCCQCHTTNLEKSWYHEALINHGEKIENLFGRKLFGNA